MAIGLALGQKTGLFRGTDDLGSGGDPDVLVGDAVTKLGALFNDAVLHDDTGFQLGIPADLDPAEDDAVLHAALHRGAVGNQAFLNVGTIVEAIAKGEEMLAAVAGR